MSDTDKLPDTPKLPDDLLRAFIGGYARGYCKGLRCAAGELHAAAREAPVSDDVRKALRLFGKFFNKAAKNAPPRGL